MAEEDVAVEEQKDTATDAKVEVEDAEEAAKPKHDFHKGLSNVQRDLNAFRRESAELRILVEKAISNVPNLNAAKTAQVQDEVEDLFEGRDPDDMPTISDYSKLVKRLSSVPGRSSSDNRELAEIVAQAVSKEVAPLAKAKVEADERMFWTEWESDHDTMSKKDGKRIWSDAAEQADEEFVIESERNAATQIYFKQMVRKEERRIKSEQATSEKKSPSTKSPTSPAGTEIAKKGADATTAAGKDKPSYDDLLKALDPQGRL